MSSKDDLREQMGADPALPVLVERIARMEKALELQAVEYERRLKTLNHEAARIGAVQAKSVTSEKFEDFLRSEKESQDVRKRAVDERVDGLIDRIHRLEAESIANVTRASQAQEGAAVSLKWQIAIIGFALTLAAIGLSFFLA